MDAFVFVIYLLLYRETWALRKNKLLIPPAVRQGERITLQCLYHLEGDDLLTVKWYKEEHEFLRYTPRNIPPIKQFHLPKLNVDTNKSDSMQIELYDVLRNYTGQYTCEVTVDVSFHTILMSADLLVVVVPEEAPQIYGMQPKYRIKDTLKLKCESQPSFPAMNLTWFINGHLVNKPQYLRRMKPILLHNGLEVAQLGLHQRLSPHHFFGNRLKVRCAARVYNVYMKSNERSVELIRTRTTQYPTPLTGLPAEHVPPTTFIWPSGSTKSRDNSSAESISSKTSVTLAVLIIAMQIIIALSNCS